MPHRTIVGVATALTLVAGAWVTTGVLQAQGAGRASAAQGTARVGAPATAARAARTVARAADGHPDLQGTYDVATITPLERPPQFGDRLSLTPKEAADLEAGERDWNARRDAPVSGDRTAPPVGGDTSKPTTFLDALFRAGGGVVGGYNNFWLAGGTSVVTVDGQFRTSIVVDPPNGRIPAMKAEARQRNARYLERAVAPGASEAESAGPANAFDNPEQRPLAERCLLGFGSTSGPPTLPNYFYNNLKQIVQTKDTVLILVEMVHDARVIRIGGTHPPATVRRWMGDSIGRWEGDTLVVDTTNFTNKTQFSGSGENLHVVERFTRLDADTILYRFTVDDPDTWDRPWSGEYTWRTTAENIYEYACHEGNEAMVNVMRGARYTEKTAASSAAR